MHGPAAAPDLHSRHQTTGVLEITIRNASVDHESIASTAAPATGACLAVWHSPLQSGTKEAAALAASPHASAGIRRHTLASTHRKSQGRRGSLARSSASSRLQLLSEVPGGSGVRLRRRQLIRSRERVRASPCCSCVRHAVQPLRGRLILLRRGSRNGSVNIRDRTCYEQP